MPENNVGCGHIFGNSSADSVNAMIDVLLKHVQCKIKSNNSSVSDELKEKDN